MGSGDNTMAKILIVLIRAYKLLLSPLVGWHCRFQPTCSHYAKDALLAHGILKGSFLGIKRVLKCHPWGGSGHDPVPKK